MSLWLIPSLLLTHHLKREAFPSTLSSIASTDPPFPSFIALFFWPYINIPHHLLIYYLAPRWFVSSMRAGTSFTAVSPAPRTVWSPLQVERSDHRWEPWTQKRDTILEVIGGGGNGQTGLHQNLGC